MRARSRTAENKHVLQERVELSAPFTSQVVPLNGDLDESSGMVYIRAHSRTNSETYSDGRREPEKEETLVVGAEIAQVVPTVHPMYLKVPASGTN